MALRGSWSLSAVLCSLLLVGCASVEVPSSGGPEHAPPTPAGAGPTGSRWAQALRFSGDVQGAMSEAVPGGVSGRSECTGATSRYAGAWASTLFGPVGRDLYGVLVTVRPYRGPGTYRAPDVTVQVLRPSDASATWQTAAGDGATFTVDTGERAGTLDATLTNLASNTTKLRVDGRWSCPG